MGDILVGTNHDQGAAAAVDAPQRMDVLRGIDADTGRQAITAGIIGIARALGIQVIAEGVETRAELDTLRGLGATLFQGYYFARPLLEALPSVSGLAQPEAGRGINTSRHSVPAASLVACARRQRPGIGA